MSIGALVRASVGVMSIGAASASIFSNDLTTPFIGVPLTTIAGAVLGVYGAIGYDEVKRPRGQLFTRAVATTILACALTSVLPNWMGWTWASGGVQAALAAIASAVIYYTMAPIIARARTLIETMTFRDIFSTRKNDPSPPPPLPPPPPPSNPTPPPSAPDEDPDK